MGSGTEPAWLASLLWDFLPLPLECWDNWSGGDTTPPWLFCGLWSYELRFLACTANAFICWAISSAFLCFELFSFRELLFVILNTHPFQICCLKIFLQFLVCPFILFSVAFEDLIESNLLNFSSWLVSATWHTGMSQHTQPHDFVYPHQWKKDF